MCLAIPMKIIRINRENATVEINGVEREVSLQLLNMNNINIGDYIIVHAGFAIQKINKEEAKRTLSILKEFS